VNPLSCQQQGNSIQTKFRRCEIKRLKIPRQTAINHVLMAFLFTLCFNIRIWAGSVTRQVIEGQTASSFGSQTDPTGCISTSVFVFVGDDRQQTVPGTGQSSSTLFLFHVNQFDFCTGSFTSTFVPPGTQLAEPDFRVDPNGQKATLNATLPGIDSFGSPVNLEVHLTWTALGSSHCGGEYVVQTPDFLSHFVMKNPSQLAPPCRKRDLWQQHTGGADGFRGNRVKSHFHCNHPKEVTQVSDLKPGRGSTAGRGTDIRR